MEYQGELKGFPREVVEKMLEYQVAQGNPRDIKVFEKWVMAGNYSGGFSWDKTPEGDDFWANVIINKNFDMFFAKYPKVSPYPKVMLVCNYDNIEHAFQRVVFMEKLGKYIAWDSVKTLKEAENEVHTYPWDYAWDLPEENPITETTAEEALKIIAEIKGINIEKLRIKK